VASSGCVRVYNAAEGWGVIDGPDVPGGCWVHFSVVAADGQLTPGQTVSFRAEEGTQDGFAYRAVKVWTDDTEPADKQPEDVATGPYHSTLTLTFDERPDADRH
jgi:CspA family cold shock protein